MNQLQIADRNIKLYIFVRIFAKRVFLPLSAIYFMDTAGFSIADIGLLAAFYSLIQLIAEVPTGYFADKWGRVTSIRLGAALALLATICYVSFQSKFGIFFGTMCEALAYSFMGGAGEALIHDSLVVKKAQDSYTKVLSRAQSISLVANAILITFVPMTYFFDHRYPFYLGALAYFSLLIFALHMRDLPRPSAVSTVSFPSFRTLFTKRHLLVFGLTYGIISSLYTSPVDMLNVALRDYGVNASLLGWVYGASSILGAILGPFIHHLRNLKLQNYLIIDLAILGSVYFAAYSHSAILLAFVMIISISIWRYRKIIYQSYLLTAYPTQYKATLLSTLNNLEQLNNIYIPLLITFAITNTSISLGFGIIGILALAIMPIYYFAAIRFFNRAKD